MNTTYNLPSVVYDPLPEPDGFGSWELKTDLAGLATALNTGVSSAKMTDIKSIPDVWAHARMFSQALLSAADPDTVRQADGAKDELHDDAVDQWRGMLALFALQPLFDSIYDVEVIPLTLSDDPRKERKFRRVLRDLEPTVSLVPGLTWNEVGVVYFRPKSQDRFARTEASPIGTLSPWVLATPGKSARTIRHPHVPWMRNGLTDPVKAGGLGQNHWSVLVRYLEEIHEQLRTLRAHTHDEQLYNDLSRELGAFHASCKRLLIEPLDMQERAALDRTLYSAVTTSFKVKEAVIPEGDSRGAVALRAGQAGGLFKGVILIDPALERTLGLAAENLRIWETKTLREAQAPETLALIKRDAAAKGYLVIEPADLFASRLVRFGDNVNIPGHPVDFVHTLLPLSPLALLLLDRDGLRRNLAMRPRSDGFEVSLTLPLLPDVQGRERAGQHTVVKLFAENEVRKEERPDDLSIWPNFESEDWPWTFLRFQYDPNYELQPRFGLSGAFLAADTAGRATGGPERVRAAMEWAASGGFAPERRLATERYSALKYGAGPVLMERLRFADVDDLVGEMQRLPLGVEAVFFARRESGPQSELPVGCCLVKPEPCAAGQTDAVASVDFGTTNTVAYVRRADALKPVAFERRLLFPIQRAHAEADQTAGIVAAYADFFPLQRHETPVPTVVKRRRFEGALPGPLQRSIGGGHDAHGVSDVIYFVPEYENVDEALRLIDAGELVFNIKWRRDPYTRKLTKRFLRQIMMMTAAELTADGVAPHMIRYRFSFPQAFLRDERRDFEDFATQAWDDLFGELKAIAEPPDRAHYVSFETEGATAARYFTRDPEQRLQGLGNLMLMLDIGGGTTDIAVWHDDQLRWRGSFRVAGGDFFTRFLANNVEILKAIDFDQIASFVQKHEDQNAENTTKFVELFVNAPKFSRNFDRNYVSFTSDDQGAGLRQCGMVALGGLMHYMGLVLGEFVRQGKIQTKDIDVLSVALGGRGSTLFRQFKRGDEADNELTRLCGLLVAAAGFEPSSVRVSTAFSKQPKHEVARGLLIDAAAGRNDIESWTAAPLGETLTMRTKDGLVALEPDQHMSRLFDARGVETVGGVELGKFLTALKRETGLSVDLQALEGKGARIISQRLGRDLRTSLDALKPEDLDEPDAQPIEPPFITELRTLIDIMNLPVSERDKVVAVTERRR